MNELVLRVCRGLANVPVPDYMGMTYEDYSALLDSLDIKYRKSEVDDENVAYGYVISTSIDIGDTINVEEGEVLTVVVSEPAGQNDDSFDDEASSLSESASDAQ